MELTSFYPVLGTEDLARSTRFYTEHLGFEVTFAADWYVSLHRPGPPAYELALLDPTHESVPAGFGRPASGVLLNFEVTDVDGEYDRLVRRAGLPLARDIRTEDWGQRHFIVVDPGGVLIDVITPTPPSAEFAAQYAEGAAQG
ncbi:glyoxalase/bleomycin resistance/extradiol dioxygenase family protein [Georgenia wutianyii]|uniref:Glyoxalase/bleomycin resistance/extradiol dioxygenase family protein n=1 Tax=Georgenia wutianyii TaxID=2585135 RepID=A0ABX5VLR2_9MICO|nr:VOC family protein [Georgenia wutianyii]QDB79419.1 glyoxalase/bleomycin resistance/extradiol dioxygenase family protein [Georgenia wutianyii]